MRIFSHVRFGDGGGSGCGGVGVTIGVAIYMCTTHSFTYPPPPSQAFCLGAAVMLLCVFSSSSWSSFTQSAAVICLIPWAPLHACGRAVASSILGCAAQFYERLYSLADIWAKVQSAHHGEHGAAHMSDILIDLGAQSQGTRDFQRRTEEASHPR